MGCSIQPSSSRQKNLNKTMHRFYLIKNSLNQNNDYQYLKITWYCWNKIGHIAINCPDFHKIEGNLK